MMPSSCDSSIQRREHQPRLLANGAVNLEPRWSPDGRRIAFTSSLYEGRWHVFTALVNDSGQVADVRRITEDRESGLLRYYYNTVDQYFSPVWSPDGRELLAISNRGHIWGSGGFWRFPVMSGGEPTGHSLRGDDLEGASRLESRRQTHRLQLLPRTPMASAVADDCDWWRSTAAHVRRFRRDRGAMVARRPAHRLHLERRWKHVPLDRRGAGWPPGPSGDAHASVPVPHGDHSACGHRCRDRGREVSARVSVTRRRWTQLCTGRCLASRRRWIRQERAEVRVRIFPYRGEISLTVPSGAFDVEITHGPEFRVEKRTITVRRGTVTRPCAWRFAG